MSTEFGYGLAFSTGLFGALHCLGMCGGLAGGCAVGRDGKRSWLALVQYHGMRIALYTLLGVAGAVAGRALVQTGLVGKVQGVLMIGAGLLVVAVGVRLLWVRGRERSFVHFRAPPLPLVGGLLNGLVPCSLLFSVAVPAATSADPGRAAGLMLAFGLGTLPTMATVSMLGLTAVRRVRGVWAQATALAVVALGAWTAWEGWVFFDIMRGLADW